MQWDDPEAGRGLGKGRAGGGVRGGRFGPVLRAAKKTGGGAAMRGAGAVSYTHLTLPTKA